MNCDITIISIIIGNIQAEVAELRRQCQPDQERLAALRKVDDDIIRVWNAASYFIICFWLIDSLLTTLIAWFYHGGEHKLSICSVL